MVDEHERERVPGSVAGPGAAALARAWPRIGGSRVFRPDAG